jgi:cobalt-zinc-cadmium resistance protein CzcA
MKTKNKLIVFVLSCFVCSAYGQSMTLEESIQYSLKNNLQIKAGELGVQQFRQLKKTHAEWGKTNLMWMHGNYNSVNTDNNITITQSIPFPTVLAQQVKLGSEQTEGAQLELAVTRNELIYQVRTTYLHLTYLKSLHQYLRSQDSLFNGFAKASSLRYQTGETNLLEKTTADVQLMEIQNQLRQNESDVMIFRTQLQSLLNSQELPDISEVLHKLSLPDSSSITTNPMLQFSKQQVVINRQLKKVEQGRFLPDIVVGYFTQTLVGWQRVGNDEVFFDRNKNFSGFQLGVSLPLWFVPQAGRAKAAFYAEAASQSKYEQEQVVLRSQLSQAGQEYRKNQITTDYYETTALKNADLILQQAQKAFRGGEIGYFEYLQALRNVQAIRFNYLSAINQLNQSIVRILYLTGKN